MSLFLQRYDGRVSGGRVAPGKAPSVDYEHLAVHVVGRAGGQKYGDRAYLSRVTHAARGNELRGWQAFARGLGALGGEEAGGRCSCW